MNMNKVAIAASVLAGLAVLSCAVSCATAKKENFEPLNYTEADVRRAEIRRIEDMAASEPARALWRAWLFRDAVSKSGAAGDRTITGQAEELFSRLAGRVSEECRKAVAAKKYYEALKYQSALEAVAAPDAGGYSAQALAELLQKDVDSKKGGTAKTQPVSSFIKGVVTVWLDLGLKVERGVGYANSALGSGFFIDKTGYIITNYHVIQSEVDPKYEGFSRLYVKLSGDPDTKIPARVVGWDPLLDIALLKAEVSAPWVFLLGSSAGLDPGDRVFAIGSPVGLESTLTSGIVSAVSRKLLSVASVIQIDAAVNSGNSGGPLIDENGNVQAIVFAGLPQFEGLNFAIPVEYLLMDLPALMAGGRVEHGWVGAYGHSWKEPVEGREGVEAQYVMPGGSLAYAGIERGAIITAFNGAAVKRLEDLQTAILKSRVNSVAVIEGLDADGKAFSRPVFLDPRPEEPTREVFKRDVVAKYFIPTFGMELVPVSTTNRRRYSVKSLIKGGIAEEAGFSENDPVEVLKTRVVEDRREASAQSYLYAELYTKKRKNGYLDVNIAIGAPLDNPYYF